MAEEEKNQQPEQEPQAVQQEEPKETENKPSEGQKQESFSNGETPETLFIENEHDEISETMKAPPSWLARMLLYLFIIFGILGIVWASVTKERISVKALCQLKTSEQPFHLLSPMNGYIQSVFVHKGDMIQEKQIMMYILDDDMVSHPVYSTFSGLIVNSNVEIPGGPIRKNQVLFSINRSAIPDLAEIYIQEKDIGKIQSGMPVQIKLSAYSSMEYGTLKAKITSLSKLPEIKQSPNGGQALYYRVEALLEENHISSKKQQIELNIGLTSMAEIIIGEKSLISILF